MPFISKNEDFGDSQKDQVRKSFDTAIGSENFEIKECILCLPYSFDKKQTKWWFCDTVLTIAKLFNLPVTKKQIGFKIQFCTKLIYKIY